MQVEKLQFEVRGQKLAALHYPGDEKCVVMAHGFGAVKEGLIPYAERFSEKFGVLLFDYRHFGESEGLPRQLIDIKKQLEDWRYAIEFARSLGYSKVAIWGTSFSGGHVLTLSSQHEVAAVVAQVPFVDGMTVARAVGIKNLLLLTLAGIWDRILSIGGRAYYIPIVASPGKFAFMTAQEAMKYLEIIPEGVEWVNAAPARVALSVPSYRPIKKVGDISCPVLYVIANRDEITPPESARKAAEKTPVAEVFEVDGDHFDVYLDLFDVCVEKEFEFLSKNLDYQE
jgi:hypothetical protein